jgi:hypothetical protein
MDMFASYEVPIIHSNSFVSTSTKLVRCYGIAFNQMKRFSKIYKTYLASYGLYLQVFLKNYLKIRSIDKNSNADVNTISFARGGDNLACFLYMREIEIYIPTYFENAITIMYFE